MKHLLYFSLSVLLSALILSVLPLKGEEAIYTNTLRLHVLAASDTTEDQTLKLLVRDRILEEVNVALSDVDDFESAKIILGDMTEHLALAAEETLRKEGCEVPVAVTLGVEVYPERRYGDVILPPGHYTSLRILIGEGEGQNWWCLLFPRLCLPLAADEETEKMLKNDGFSDSACETVTSERPQIRVKWKILELLSGLFVH